MQRMTVNILVLRIKYPIILLKLIVQGIGSYQLTAYVQDDYEDLV
jgi:hypothetical protein